MGGVLGLTGSFGSGKTSVAGWFAQLGAFTIDADELARQAVEPGREALEEIVEAFGAEVLDADGRLRRDELARRTFGDRRALARLNGIVHPRVYDAARRLIRDRGGTTPVVFEVPLLFETGGEALTDRVVVVVVGERQRFARLRGRGFSEKEIVARLGHQMAQARKVRRADDVIDNSGTPEATRRRVREIWDDLSRTM